MNFSTSVAVVGRKTLNSEGLLYGDHSEEIEQHLLTQKAEAEKFSLIKAANCLARAERESHGVCSPIYDGERYFSVPLAPKIVWWTLEKGRIISFLAARISL